MIRSSNRFTFSKFLKFSMLFWSLYSVDVFFNLLTLDKFRKDLFLWGYLLYALIVLPLIGLIFSLLKGVGRFSPTDDSSFFGFWAIILPLMQSMPAFYLHLPPRFVSMTLVLSLFFSITAGIIWHIYSRNTKRWRVGPLFLWFQILLLVGIQTTIYLKEKYIYSVFSFRGLLFLGGLILIIIALLVLGKLIYPKISTRLNGRWFTTVQLFANLAVIGLVLYLPVQSWHHKNPPAHFKAFQNSLVEKNYPNIILITMDGVRKDKMDLYGYDIETMPHIKQWVEEATVYTNCYSNSSWFLPSLGSLITGLYPSNHGAQNDYRKNDHAHPEKPLEPSDYIRSLSEVHTTLPELLRSNGYLTVAISGKFKLFNRASGLTQGFTHYRSDQNGVPNLLPYRLLMPLNRFLTPLVKIYKPYRPAEYLTEDALGWINEFGSKPFFMMINYEDATIPLDPVPRYKKMFYDEKRVKKAKYPKQVKQVMYYHAQLRYLDDQLAGLRENLKSHEWYDRSLIIVTSLHGESLGDWGMYGHGLTLAEREIGIPLAVKYPKQVIGKTADHLVQTVDIFQTILKAAYNTTLETVDGIELKKTDNRTVIAELDSSPLLVLEYGNNYLRSLKAFFVNDRKIIIPSTGAPKVYDVSSDPQERNNLFKKNLELARRIKKTYGPLLGLYRQIITDAQRKELIQKFYEENNCCR